MPDEQVNQENAFLLCFLTPAQLRLLELVIKVRNFICFWDAEVDPAIKTHNLSKKK